MLLKRIRHIHTLQYSCRNILTFPVVLQFVYQKLEKHARRKLVYLAVQFRVHGFSALVERLQYRELLHPLKTELVCL